MLKQLLERLSLCSLNRMPVMPIRIILFCFILIPAMQVLFLIAGIASIFLSDGWTYVVILFTQTILTIIAGIVLSNLRDGYLNRYYHSQFLEVLHLGRGSNMAPVLREARRRGGPGYAVVHPPDPCPHGHNDDRQSGADICKHNRLINTPAGGTILRRFFRRARHP